MEPIIHIGYPKTATTWFQKNYFPKIKNAIFIPRNEIINEFTREYEINFNSDEIREKYLEIVGEQQLILSLEDLSGNINNIGINRYSTKENALRLNSVFPKAKIIIFIRNQLDIIASSYMQYIKGGGTYGISRYLSDRNLTYPDNLVPFAFEYFEYHRIIQLYKSLFGDENIKVFLYEEFLENNLSFLSQLNKIFSFQVDLNNLNYKKINENYRSSVMIIAKFFNLFTCQKRIHKYYLFHIPKWYHFSRTILKSINKYPIFGNHPTTNRILGEKNMEIITNYYKSSNNYLVISHDLHKIKNYSYPI